LRVKDFLFPKDPRRITGEKYARMSKLYCNVSESELNPLEKRIRLMRGKRK
jgi:hypothetical protein